MTMNRETFLVAMRNVANSVTVVTTDGDAGRNGATVSSFCSVSADPPTLLVCLNRSGSTASTIRLNGRFCVNILPENHRETAQAFARPDTPKLELFAKTPWQHDVGPCPYLDDATAFFCDVSEVMEATSHDIFIGNVKAVNNGYSKPLIYLDQAYHSVRKNTDI